MSGVDLSSGNTVSSEMIAIFVKVKNAAELRQAFDEYNKEIMNCGLVYLSRLRDEMIPQYKIVADNLPKDKIPLIESALELKAPFFDVLTDFAVNGLLTKVQDSVQSTYLRAKEKEGSYAGKLADCVSEQMFDRCGLRPQPIKDIPEGELRPLKTFMKIVGDAALLINASRDIRTIGTHPYKYIRGDIIRSMMGSRIEVITPEELKRRNFVISDTFEVDPPETKPPLYEFVGKRSPSMNVLMVFGDKARYMGNHEVEPLKKLLDSRQKCETTPEVVSNIAMDRIMKNIDWINGMASMPSKMSEDPWVNIIHLIGSYGIYSELVKILGDDMIKVITKMSIFKDKLGKLARSRKNADTSELIMELVRGDGDINKADHIVILTMAKIVAIGRSDEGKQDTSERLLSEEDELIDSVACMYARSLKTY